MHHTAVAHHQAGRVPGNRTWDFPRDVDVKFLQHLRTQNAIPLAPKLTENTLGSLVLALASTSCAYINTFVSTNVLPFMHFIPARSNYATEMKAFVEKRQSLPFGPLYASSLPTRYSIS